MRRLIKDTLELFSGSGDVDVRLSPGHVFLLIAHSDHHHADYARRRGMAVHRPLLFDAPNLVSKLHALNPGRQTSSPKL